MTTAGVLVLFGAFAAAARRRRFSQRTSPYFVVVPMVRAAWMAMAEKPVYRHYGNQPVRVWNIDAINDQQVAGLIMKVGGGIFLWVIVVYMFFKRFGIAGAGENSYRRAEQGPMAPSARKPRSPSTR